MSAYKVEICGVNTAKLPVLKEKEKEQLFERIQKGDPVARETYIKGNLRLVLSVIRRFSGNNENVDDLFQIGCIGLIKSIDNFNPDMGVKFSTYAVPMIIGRDPALSPRQQLHPRQPLTPRYCLQGDPHKRAPLQKFFQGTDTPGDCPCKRSYRRRDSLCPRCHPKPGQPLRPGLYRRRRYPICHGSDQ